MYLQTEINNYLTTWLLDEDNPSVRCRTLTELLDRPEDDSETLSPGPVIALVGSLWQAIRSFISALAKQSRFFLQGMGIPGV